MTTIHYTRPGDLDRQADPIGYDLAKHGEAVANQATKLRSAILSAHQAEWTEDRIAARAGITIEEVQRTILKAEAARAAPLRRRLNPHRPQRGDCEKVAASCRLHGWWRWWHVL